MNRLVSIYVKHWKFESLSDDVTQERWDTWAYLINKQTELWMFMGKVVQKIFPNGRYGSFLLTLPKIIGIFFSAIEYLYFRWNNVALNLRGSCLIMVKVGGGGGDSAHELRSEGELFYLEFCDLRTIDRFNIWNWQKMLKWDICSCVDLSVIFSKIGKII